MMVNDEEVDVDLRPAAEAVPVVEEEQPEQLSLLSLEKSTEDLLIERVMSVSYTHLVSPQSDRVIRLPGVFTMRTPDDAIALRAYVQDRHCRSAVVVGAGFIGLEIAENLQAQGLAVTVIDAADQILPKIFDPEMAGYARRRLRQNLSLIHI